MFLETNRTWDLVGLKSWYRRDHEGEIPPAPPENRIPTIPLSDPGFRKSEMYLYNLSVYAVIYLFPDFLSIQ